MSVALDLSDTSPTCLWCEKSLPTGAVRHHARTCSKLCRQRLWRFHVAPGPSDPHATPTHFGYADPPYPGKASLYPENSEVDHRALVLELEATYPDGWALSTASGSLRDILPLCPPTARVCAWLKKVRPHKHARILCTWEPLIIMGGRKRRHEATIVTRDALIARGRFHAHPNAMVGMKPPAYATWLFQLLGAVQGDTLDDLFPGSGAITRAWRLYTHVARDTYNRWIQQPEGLPFS